MLSVNIEQRTYTEGAWYRSVINGNFYKIIRGGYESLAKVDVTNSSYQMEIDSIDNQVLIHIPAPFNGQKIDFTSNDTIAASLGLPTFKEMLTYKGWQVYFEFDLDERVILGQVDLSHVGLVTKFTAENADEALTKFRSLVDEYIEFVNEE